MRAFLTILKIETNLVIRSIDTLFFGVGFPALVALCMGLLMKDSEVFASTFAAVSTIGICATGLMGIPLTLSDYRHRKILKRYSVTPISPLWILLVQCIINYLIALLSVIVVYLIYAYGFGFQWQGSLIGFLLAFSLNAFAMYGVGMLIASISPNVKTSNLLCTLIYFPMIFLSGTVIPYALMPDFLQMIMDFSPLTQGIELLNAVLFTSEAVPMMPILVLTGIGSLGWLIAVRYFRWT